MFSHAELLQHISYDPETGLFSRKVSRTNGKGGWLHKDGYVYIYAFGKTHSAHRLAWFYMTGEWPDPEVDHENGRRTDNRWVNLREATVVEQRQNRGGVLGAYQDKRRGSWHASIRINGKRTNLGAFPTAEAAHAAYVEAKARLHPFQPTVRALEP